MTEGMLLTRAPFQPLAIEESWDGALLAEAATLVGYRPTALLKAEEVRKRSLDEVIFARALEAVDIQPFTLRSVETYKARMLKRAHKGESWPITQYMHRSGISTMQEGQMVVHAVGWPAWAASLVLGIPSLCMHFVGTQEWGWDGHKSIELTRYMPWQTVGHIMLVPAVALSAWGLLMYLRYKKAHAVFAAWNKRQVHDTNYQHANSGYSDGYKEPIPAFAIQRMVSLKKALPEVTFSVEQLDVTKKDLNVEHRVLPPPRPDPFLIATFRGISCYVDVWDEPAFEGRRSV
jgi:hypothetical protein